jgi:hypothetical protein
MVKLGVKKKVKRLIIWDGLSSFMSVISLSILCERILSMCDAAEFLSSMSVLLHLYIHF